MAAELPEGTLLRFTTEDLPPEHLVSLVVSMREAFQLAKRGASAQGYQRLCAARDRAIRTLGQGETWEPELLRCWNQAVLWYERFATPPPH